MTTQSASITDGLALLAPDAPYRTPPRWVAYQAGAGVDGTKWTDTAAPVATPMIRTGAWDRGARIAPDATSAYATGAIVSRYAIRFRDANRDDAADVAWSTCAGMSTADVRSGRVVDGDAATAVGGIRRQRTDGVAADWQGADWWSPICLAPVKPRTGDARECGQTMRPTLSGGRVCPRHGADVAWRYPTDAPADTVLAGTRSGKRRADITDHVAWCDAKVTRADCYATGAPYVRGASCQRRGTALGWTCPDHGAADVRGCDIPRAVDDGTGAALVRQYRGMTAVSGGIDHGHNVDAATGQTRTVYVDAERGQVIRDGNRGSYAARSKGRRGQQVTPEPSAPVMASGRWATRTSAPAPTGSAVLVYSANVAACGEHPRTVHPLDWVHAADCGQVSVKTLVAVLTAAGTPATLTGAIYASTRAAVIRRESRAARILERQVVETAPDRSRRSSVAGNASGRKRTAAAEAKRAAEAARIARAHSKLVSFK